MSSGAGRAGIAVIRLSGPGALTALAVLVPGLEPRPRHAHRARFVDPADGTLIDAGLALGFPAPASFTGEDVAELHVHGSPAVLEKLFAVLRAIGVRVAAPGEFTRRAFANGKLDLAEAEGLADLIASDSDSQRVQALAQMGGAWAARIADWQARLLDALAWLEAGIDFADERDIPEGTDARAAEPIAAVTAAIAVALADKRAGEIIRDGLWVAIIGPPNVGKSTLLNTLVGREAAIVSDIPGTTRDIVEVRLDMDGYVVVFADTAGLRESDDPIEREGVRRARARAADADLRIFLGDASDSESPGRVGLETESLVRPGDILFLNKVDLAGGRPAPGAPPWWPGSTPLRGSAARGDIDALLDAVRARLHDQIDGACSALITRARHREALVAAHAALVRAANAPLDLAAEDVRLALQALARILGRFDVEQVLDRIFSAFCIGK